MKEEPCLLRDLSQVKRRTRKQAFAVGSGHDLGTTGSHRRDTSSHRAPRKCLGEPLMMLRQQGKEGTCRQVGSLAVSVRHAEADVPWTAGTSGRGRGRGSS